MSDSEQDGFAGIGLEREREGSVERPADLEALREVVRQASRTGRPVFPRGGGTATEWGALRRGDGLVLETTGLDRVIDYPASDMTITVEAGITLAAVQAILGKEGQRLTLDPPRADRATVGGIYATGWSGPRRFGLGLPRDQIIGISFVTGEGTLVHGGGRVVKNVAGYDFPKLLTGSGGTLGIITQVTLKVRPVPETSALVAVEVPLVGFELADLLASLNTSRTRPVALELLNGPAAARALGDGPARPGDGVLVLGFEGSDETVAWQTRQAETELAKAITPARGESSRPRVYLAGEAERVWSGLVEFNAAVPEGCASIRIGAVASALVGRMGGEAQNATGGLLELLPAEEWEWRAHAGNGVIDAHTRGVMGPDELGRRIDELRRLLGERSPRARLVVTDCDAAVKERLSSWGERSGEWGLMERLKAEFDPAGILNPGLFVGKI
jgi:glycolate oxidase FAD binding subunit